MAVKTFIDESTGKIIVRGVKVVPGQMDLIYRNFAGAKTDYNEAGNRNFCIKVDEADVEALLEANINIKVRVKPLADGRKLKTVLDEDSLKSLDKALIADASISVSPYFSKKNKRWTCYLASMMFTPLIDPIQEEIDALDSVYPTEDDECPFE